MAIRRYEGLFPTGTLLIPNSTILPARSWLNPLNSRLAPGTVVAVTDEPFIVPAGLAADCHIRLDLIPYGNILDTDVFTCYTGTGKTGTQYTATLSDAALSDETVWLLPGFPWAAVPATAGGSTLYFTYNGVYSGFDMTDAAYLWESIRALQTSQGLFSVTLVAGENLEDQFVYISEVDNKVYIADPVDLEKVPTGFVAGTVTSGSSCTVLARGLAEPTESTWTIPVGQILYGGNNGGWTYYADTGGDKLVTGDYRKPIGRSYDGTTIYFDGLLDVTQQV